MNDQNTINNQEAGLEFKIEGGQPVVSSTEIALHFNKDHEDVLANIDNIEPNVDPEWFEQNFRHMPSENGEAYHLTRDGFSLLAIGVTGKKAMAMRYRFIEALANLESLLRSNKFDKYLNQAALNQPVEDRITHSRAVIEGLLGFWANQDGLSYKTVCKLLCSHLYISSLDDLQTDQFSEAWQYIVQSACFMANKNQDMAPEKYENVQRLLVAAAHFRHSQDLDAEAILHDLCGASINSIPSVDGSKLLALAWGIFQYSRGYSSGVAQGQEAIIKDLVK